jgi:hypothetical protein
MEGIPFDEHGHAAAVGHALLDTERDKIFGEWLAAHKGILFKVVHAQPLRMPTARTSFRKSPCRSGVPSMRSAASPP